jgi:hypothetical protein
MFRGAGSPYGASSVSGTDNQLPTPTTWKSPRFQGGASPGHPRPQGGGETATK